MFASPSVLIKEVDKSALVKVSGLGLSVIILDAEIGPVDTLVQIDSEKTLYDTFGKPNDHNYEAWFAISTVIKYGGTVGVIRPSVSSGDYRLTNANIQKPERIPGISYDQNLIIKNQDDFEKVLNKDFLFSARYAGEYYNDIVVSIVDHGADQIIDFSDSIEELAVGDIITTSTGKKAIIYITGQPLTISLFEPNRRFEIGEEVYDSNNNLIGTVNEILENRIYDTLECVPGLKWSSFIGQPNTSEYCKQRNSKFDEFHIAVIDKSGRITGRPNSILEVFPFLSKAVDCRSSDGSSLFWRNVINRKSQYIYVGDDKLLIYDDSNPSFFTVFTREGTTEMVSSTRVITRENGMIYFGNDVNNPFSELLYYQTVSDDIICGNIDQKANSNYFALFRNLEEDFFNTPVFNFTLLGGQSYNYDDPELVYADIVASYDIFSDRNQFGDIDFILPGRITSDILVKLVQIVEQRKDCLTVCSPKKDAVINNSFDTIKVENIISFFRTLPTSTYAILDSGWKKIYDKFNDVYRYVPCAADVAGLCIRASRTNESWISPAGYIRGILMDGGGLYFSPNRSEAFRLYKNGINPIVNFKGIGTVLFGDKTSKISNSAFHYIGVRRLFLQIERDIERMSKFFLFEFNDQTGRTAYTDAVNGYLRGIQGKRGIYDFKIVCDESNNDFDVIDQNGLNVDIYINPSRTINCIEIKLIVTSTGVSFNEFEDASSVGSECDNPYAIQESETSFQEFPIEPPIETNSCSDSGPFVCWWHTQGDDWATGEYVSVINAPPGVEENVYYEYPNRVFLFSGDGTQYAQFDFKDSPLLPEQVYDKKLSYSGDDISNDIWGITYSDGSTWSSWQYFSAGQTITPLSAANLYQYVPNHLTVPYQTKVRTRTIDSVELRAYPQFDGAVWATGDVNGYILPLPINKHSCVIVGYQNSEEIRNQIHYRIDKESVPLTLVEVVRVESPSDDADILRETNGRYYITSSETLNPTVSGHIESITNVNTKKAYLVTKDQIIELNPSNKLWEKLFEYYGPPNDLEEVNIFDEFWELTQGPTNVSGGNSVSMRFASTNILEQPPSRIYHPPQIDDPVPHEYWLRIRANTPIGSYMVRQYVKTDWPFDYVNPSEGYRIEYDWLVFNSVGPVWLYNKDDYGPVEGMGISGYYATSPWFDLHVSSFGIYDNILGNFNYTNQTLNEDDSVGNILSQFELPPCFYFSSLELSHTETDIDYRELEITGFYDKPITEFRLARYSNIPENISDENNSEDFSIYYWDRNDPQWTPILDEQEYDIIELAPIGQRLFVNDNFNEFDTQDASMHPNFVGVSTYFSPEGESLIPQPIYTHSYESGNEAIQKLSQIGINLTLDQLNTYVFPNEPVLPIIRISGNGEPGVVTELTNEGYDTDATITYLPINGNLNRLISDDSDEEFLSNHTSNGILDITMSRSWIGSGDYTVKLKLRFRRTDLMENNARYDNWIFVFPNTFSGLYFWDYYEDTDEVELMWWNTYVYGSAGASGNEIRIPANEWIEYKVVRKNGILYEFINNSLQHSFLDYSGNVPVDTIVYNSLHDAFYINTMTDQNLVVGQHKIHMCGSYDGYHANFDFEDFEVYNFADYEDEILDKGLVYDKTILYSQTSLQYGFPAGDGFMRNNSNLIRGTITQDIPDSYITLELDDVYEIRTVDLMSQIELYSNSLDLQRQLTLEMSVDGTTWYYLPLEYDISFDLVLGYINIPVETQAKYIRIGREQSHNILAVGLTEFNPFLLNPNPVDYIYTQSSYYEYGARPATLARMATGATDNYCAATYSSNSVEWIMVDLREIKSVQSVDIGAVGNYDPYEIWDGVFYTYGHDIEYSLDGTNWNSAGTTGVFGDWASGNTINTYAINTNARYIRIVSYTGDYIAVGEFKVNLN